jgi:sulfur carrier protein ThiS
MHISPAPRRRRDRGSGLENSGSAAMTRQAQSDSAAATAPTIQITLKLFALLAGYLPDGAKNNQIELAVHGGSTPASVMASLHLPPKLCALVFLNGTFVHLAERSTRRLEQGDVLAMWPPIAGG